MTADEPRDSLRAHSVEVTTEWFLHHLRSTPAGRPDFLYADELFTEPLCWELLSRLFVHRLRRAVSSDRANTEAIEALAESLLTGWPGQQAAGLDQYPKLACLLVSIGRRRLQECVYEQGLDALEKCPLYRLGMELYERGRREGASQDEARYALVAGVQLEKVQTTLIEDSAWKWYWRYLQFRRERSADLETLRYHYLGLDPRERNPVELVREIRRYVQDVYAEALQLDPGLLEALHPYPLNRRANSEEGSLSLDLADPLTFDFPIFADAAGAGRLLQAFTDLVHSNEDDEQKDPKVGEARERKFQDFNLEFLALPLRIVQWELQTRDIGKEQMKGEIFFSPSVEVARDREIGFPPNRFLDALLRRSLETHLRFLPALDSFPNYRQKAFELRNPDGLMKSFQACRGLFRRLVSDLDRVISESYPEAHKDYLLALSKPGHRPPFGFINLAVVEDGELSFFGLIWALRTAAGLGDPVRKWSSGSGEERIRLLFAADAEEVARKESIDWFHEDRFKAATPMELAVALGFALPVQNGQVLTTRRWRSFLDWLQRIHRTGRTRSDPSALANWEPIKKLEWSDSKEGRRFVEMTREVVLSPSLDKYLSHAVAAVYPDCKEEKEFVVDLFCPLLSILEPLWAYMKPGLGTTGMHDQTLFRAARTAYFPLEFLVRAYQPHEAQLVICPVGIDASPALGEGSSAPISLGFATILGALPSAVKHVLSSPESPVEANGKELETVKERREWAAPYWAIFAGFTSVLSLGRTSRQSLESGMYKMLGAMSHETANAVAFMSRDALHNLSTLFNIDTTSNPGNRTPTLVGVADDDRGILAKWRVCPVPDTFEDARKLCLLWAGSKNTLADIGLREVESRSSLAQVLDTVVTIARSAVSMRKQLGSVSAGYDTTERVFNFARAKFEEERTLDHWAKKIDVQVFSRRTAPAAILFLDEGLKGEEYMGSSEVLEHILAHFCRGLIAAMANALYHSSSNAGLSVVIDWKPESSRELRLDIWNPFDEATSGLLYKTEQQTHFLTGTKAVCKYCFESRLEGEFFMKADDPPVFFGDGRGGWSGWFRSSVKLPSRLRGGRWVKVASVDDGEGGT